MRLLMVLLLRVHGLQIMEIVDARGSAVPRTWTTVNLNKGGTLKTDQDFLTITNLIADLTQPITVKVT